MKRRMIPLLIVLSLLFSLFLVAPVSVSAYAIVKVACVGDSITDGFGHEDTKSYPYKLGQLLGDDYSVVNFGTSGRTVLKTGDAPYINYQDYADSIAFLPDIVIIMLGTNDGKPYNWADGKKENFKDDITSLINTYKALASSPTVYLATSPTAFNDGAYDIIPANVEIIAELQREVAEELDCPLIDMNDLTENKESYFPDNIHPSDEGYTYFAQQFYQALLAGKTAPSSPVGMRSIDGNKRSVVMWNDGNKGGSPITGYKVFVDGELFKSVTSPTVLINGLTNGDTYNITVSAINKSGESSQSQPLTVYPTAATPSVSGVEDGKTYDLYTEEPPVPSWTTQATATLDGEVFVEGTAVDALGDHTLVITNDNVVVTVVFTVTDTTPKPQYSPGDIDMDGEVTVADALAALRMAVRLAEHTDDDIELGDIDGDGSITVSDALAILRKAAKLTE